MLQGSYGKEPFDLRLTVFRLLKQLHIIIGVTVLGMILFGGGYYTKTVLLRGEPQYGVTSVYRVEFNGETEAEIAIIYINDYTWNTYMQTDLFVDAVMGHLVGADTLADGTPLDMDKAEIRASIQAFLYSDLRVPSTMVTTSHPEKSALIARAVEKAMCNELAEFVREVASIKVMHAGEPEELIPDVRMSKALALSAILSFFFVLLFLLIKETWADSIYLPASVWKRYGVKCVGGLKQYKERIYTTPEFEENMRYFTGGVAKIAVCPVTENIAPDAVLQTMRKLNVEPVGEKWFAVPAPLLCPEVCDELRGADGILLVVNSGEHVGKSFERVLEFLKQQNCEVTAVVLNEVDEQLLKWYYLV